MKFTKGDLVSIVGTNGEIVKNSPPALVLSSSIGVARSIDTSKKRERVYTILYMGNIDTGVLEEWLDHLSFNHFSKNKLS